MNLNTHMFNTHPALTLSLTLTFRRGVWTGSSGCNPLFFSYLFWCWRDHRWTWSGMSVVKRPDQVYHSTTRDNYNPIYTTHKLPRQNTTESSADSFRSRPSLGKCEPWWGQGHIQYLIRKWPRVCYRIVVSIRSVGRCIGHITAIYLHSRFPSGANWIRPNQPNRAAASSGSEYNCSQLARHPIRRHPTTNDGQATSNLSHRAAAKRSDCRWGRIRHLWIGL